MNAPAQEWIELFNWCMAQNLLPVDVYEAVRAHKAQLELQTEVSRKLPEGTIFPGETT